MKLEALKKDWDGWDEDAFFETGRTEIAGVMRDLERLGLPARRERCLDFGCGVGRLTQAFARYFTRCDGVDIAPSMLEEARRFNRLGDRIALHLNDTDGLSLFPDGTFDFIYSNIVLQYVGPEAAKAYIREFVRLLAPGGLALFQLPSENIRAELRETYRLPENAFRARIAAEVPAETEPGRRLTVEATVTNESPRPWPADPPTDVTCRIQLGNHWFTTAGRAPPSSARPSVFAAVSRHGCGNCSEGEARPMRPAGGSSPCSTTRPAGASGAPSGTP
jgi:SAM-dependent methyltransferase